MCHRGRELIAPRVVNDHRRPEMENNNICVCCAREDDGGGGGGAVAAASAAAGARAILPRAAAPRVSFTIIIVFL